MTDEKTEVAHDRDAWVEHLRRRRRRWDGGDFYMHGGWILWAGTVAAWFWTIVH